MLFSRVMNKRKLKNEELNRLTPDEFKSTGKIPVTVVLDNIRSFNNVGSVFRTSDAFRVEKIVLCGITACPPHREITKTAIGAEETVEWVYFKETSEAVRELKKEGFFLFAVEQTEQSASLSELSVSKPGKVGIVFGNEVFGVDQKVIDACDETLEIPQEGTKHSLNISVSCGIVLWEFFKRLRD